MKAQLMPTHNKVAVGYSNESVRRCCDRVPWLWEGLIALDAITLLSAPEKTGKTTLLSLLLDRRREGGQLLGRTVLPDRTVVCSEENHELWALRQPPLDLGSQVEFHRPIATPTPRRWRRYINYLLELPFEAFDLLVIDTAMAFLPAARNNPAALRRALEKLRVVSGMPAGVLLLHQASAPRGRSRARGPLTAFADILIEMQAPPGDRFSRRRNIDGVGRYPGTLQEVSAELNAEGTDYVVLDSGLPEPASCPLPETLKGVLSQSASPLTRQEILARWPQDEPPPTANSLWRALTRACDQGLVLRSGEGTKTDAYRYALPDAGALKAAGIAVRMIGEERINVVAAREQGGSMGCGSGLLNRCSLLAHRSMCPPRRSHDTNSTRGFGPTRATPVPHRR
jgi:hypothetical protein